MSSGNIAKQSLRLARPREPAARYGCIDAGLRDCADQTSGEDPGEMASTGANVVLIALLSVLLVAAGTFLVVWRNRRRSVL